MHLALFSDLKDTTPHPVELTFTQLQQDLMEPPQIAEGPLLAPPTKNDKEAKQKFDRYKDGRLFSLAKFKPGHTRGNDAVEALYGLVLDYDGEKDENGFARGLTPVQVDALFAWLESADYRFATYTSFTSGYCAPNQKLRVVLFFDEPVRPSDYKQIWRAITNSIPVPVDTSSGEYARAYYGPRVPREHLHLYDSSCGGTKLIATKSFLSGMNLNDAKLFEKKDWEQELRSTSEKHNTLVKAAYGLGAKAGLSGEALEPTIESTWRVCRAALENNPTAVQDWSAAEKTCRARTEAGWRKGNEERPAATEMPEQFIPTAKQLDRAEKALREEIKGVDKDCTRVKTAAYELGRYVPHVLDAQRVYKELFKAATQISDSRNQGMNGAQAELEIAAGLEKGKRSPHFVFPGWRAKLLVDKDAGTIIPCEENARLFLQYHNGVKDLLRYNVRSGKVSVMFRPPWLTDRTEFPHDLADHDGLDIGLWLGEQLGRPLQGGYRQAVRVAGEVGRKNEYDPFKDWLEEQTWDQTPRLDSWLHKTCGVEDNVYHQLVGSKWLMSAVARTLTPGCEAQHVLLLNGPQGIGKSQALKAVASAAYFCANPGELGSEDMIFNLSKYVVVELAELAGFRKKEMDEIKRLISNTSEDLRRKYAALSEQILRRAVFGGTTNEQEFLRDETGNRRFWPVECHASFDIEWLESNRAQLWAEAHARVLAGGKWWPETEEEKKLLNQEQEKHLELDELHEKLDELLLPVTMSQFVGCEPTSDQLDSTTGRLVYATMPQIYHLLGLRIQDRGDQLRLKRMLKIKDWTKKSITIKDKTFKAVCFHTADTGTYR